MLNSYEKSEIPEKQKIKIIYILFNLNFRSCHSQDLHKQPLPLGTLFGCSSSSLSGTSGDTRPIYLRPQRVLQILDPLQND